MMVFRERWFASLLIVLNVVMMYNLEPAGANPPLPDSWGGGARLEGEQLGEVYWPLGEEVRGMATARTVRPVVPEGPIV